MKRLNQKEIEKFAKKYFPEWETEITEVSLLEYKNTKEYLVNNHYLIIETGNKVTRKDLQECLYNN